MAITISTAEILALAPLNYHKGCSSNVHDLIYQCVTNCISAKKFPCEAKQIASTKPHQVLPTHVEIDMSQLIVDEESLPGYIANTPTLYLEDYDDCNLQKEVEAYLESQRLHKLRFLKEVKDRGLVLKNKKSYQNGVDEPSLSQNTFMNY